MATVTSLYGTLGNFETSDVKFNLKEDAKPYHAKTVPVQKHNHDTLKHEIEIPTSDSQWATPTFIIPKKNETVRFIYSFIKLNGAGIRGVCVFNSFGFEHGILTYGSTK
jgi:hypothetical protein